MKIKLFKLMQIVFNGLIRHIKMISFVVFLLLVMPFRFNEMPKIYLYMDFASTPTLAQLIDATRQPASFPKLFLWRRFQALDDHDWALKSLSAIMPLNREYGNKKFDYANLMQKEIVSFIKKYPEHNIIVHLNNRHYQDFYEDILRNDVPLERVEHVYVYEDSAGRLFWDRYEEKERLNALLRLFDYQKTTLYALNVKKLPDDIFLGKLKELSFVNMHWWLSHRQKEIISHIAGIDFSIIKRFFDEKTVVFIDDPILTDENLQLFFAHVKEKYPQTASYQWLYKNHPRKKGAGRGLKYIQNFTKKVMIIPNQMPYELLLIEGLVPDYIGGSSSSVFFEKTKSKVIGYVPRESDPYLPLLLLWENLNREDILWKK